MKKILTAVFATSILATVPMGMSTTYAEAGCKGWKCFRKGVATGVGIGVGAAITERILRPREPEVVVIEREPRPVYREPAPAPVGYSARHYNWCKDRYRSYDVPSNTYQPYSKPYRQQCRSPYG